MLGRSKSPTVVDTGSRAADTAVETAQEIAQRALVAAREAQRVATPVLRSAAEKSAETLSHAAERAAVVLADTAEKLAETSEEHAATASDAARTKLADASESLAKAVRPAKKTHRVRRALTAALVVGGVVALVRSPLKGKIADRIFGAPPEFDDDEPESITLPTTSASSEPDLSEQEAPASPEGGESNGVASATGVHGEGQVS